MSSRKRTIFVAVLIVIVVVLAATLAMRAYGAADRTETVNIYEKAAQHRIRVVIGSGQVNMTLLLDNGDERCGITIPSQKARALGTDLKQAATDADGTASP